MEQELGIVRVGNSKGIRHMLDATTKDTALKSLSQYLNVEPSYLPQTLRERQIPEACDHPAEDLLNYVQSEFGVMQKPLEGVWFHGSRVQSPLKLYGTQVSVLKATCWKSFTHI